MAGAIGRVLSGQYSNNFAPIKLIMEGLSNIGTSSIDFRMPLLKTAQNTNIPYLIRARILKYDGNPIPITLK